MTIGVRLPSLKLQQPRLRSQLGSQLGRWVRASGFKGLRAASGFKGSRVAGFQRFRGTGLTAETSKPEPQKPGEPASLHETEMKPRTPNKPKTSVLFPEH